jgi:hypothetical protein
MPPRLRRLYVAAWLLLCQLGPLLCEQLVT